MKKRLFLLLLALPLAWLIYSEGQRFVSPAAPWK